MPIEDGGRARADVLATELVETCLEPSLEGEYVLDPDPARGGVEGPALAFGRADAWLAVLEASRDTEAVEACFAPAGLVY